jgi:hypothetical protein
LLLYVSATLAVFPSRNVGKSRPASSSLLLITQEEHNLKQAIEAYTFPLKLFYN